jgi:hypothetical protein
MVEGLTKFCIIWRLRSERPRIGVGGSLRAVTYSTCASHQYPHRSQKECSVLRSLRWGMRCLSARGKSPSLARHGIDRRQRTYAHRSDAATILIVISPLFKRGYVKHPPGSAAVALT